MAQLLLTGCAIIIVWEVMRLKVGIDVLASGVTCCWGSACVVQHDAGAGETFHQQHTDTHAHQRKLEKL